MNSTTDPPPLVHPTYRPDIDGLRAIAVIAVVAFHAFPEWMRAGFIGVDVFFVISGFLISSIIFRSLSAQGFSYRTFYARRIRRIFPALALVLAATLAIGWWVLLPHEWVQLGKHLFAGAAFVSNFAFWSEAGYFDTVAETKPLLHLWSLAIEEQFYIVWPLLLGLAYKRKWRLSFVVGALAAASFALNISTVHSHQTAAFYSPLSRFWELMIGGALAWWRQNRPDRLTRYRDLQSVFGLLCIVLGLVLIRNGRTFPGTWALLPTVGTFYCISAGPTAFFNRKLLAARPLVWIGLISYPLYLWHWPLLVFARIVGEGKPNLWIRFAIVLASFMLAWLTYRLLELRLRHNGRRVVVVMLIAAMVTLGAAGLLANRHALPNRHNDAYISEVVAAKRDWTYPDGLTPMQIGDQLIYRIGSGGGNVLLFGDSHIEQYGPRAVALAKELPDQLNTLFFATWGGCPPIPGVVDGHNVFCDPRRKEMIRYALGRDVDSVVVGGCWNCYFVTLANPALKLPEGVGFFYVDADGRHPFQNGDGVEKALESLERLLKLLSVQKKVYLLLDVPVGAAFGPEKLISGSRLGTLKAARLTPTAPLPEAQRQLNTRLREIAKRAGVSVIDPLQTLCIADQCIRTTTDGKPIYKDADHLRASFTAKFADWLDVALIRPK